MGSEGAVMHKLNVITEVQLLNDRALELIEISLSVLPQG